MVEMTACEIGVQTSNPLAAPSSPRGGDRLQVELNTELKVHSYKNYIHERTPRHLLTCHFAN